MPSPELQSAIDSFDYRSYLKLNGYTDEQIPESLDEETKQKLFSLAYKEHFDNLVKERQATTPGHLTPKDASDEVEAEELEAKPYLRPLFGLWERELGAEELYKAEMLFPLLKEEGIDVSTPYFDPEALGEEQSKKKLKPILDRYVEQVINKKTPKNAPELKGVGKSEFKQQFLQRNGLFAEDDIGSFLKVYKKNADTEAIQQDVDERGTLGWLGDLLPVAANQGMDMLVSSIPSFVQHRLQGTRIPGTDILLSDPLQQTVGEGTSWFTNKLLDLGDWSRRKSAKLAEEREKMQFKPRYGGTLEDYWDRGEWTNIGGALMEQLVLNGSSVVQNIATPLFINFGSRVVTPITTGVGGLFGPGGAAAGLAVGRAATLGIAGGMMGTGALMTASDAIADLHELGIYDDAQVNKYLEHIYTAVALDSMSTLMEAAIIGGGKFIGPIGKNRQAIRAQQQANNAAARANGLDTNVINHLAGRQLLRNRGLTNEANRRIWQRMATGDGAWRVMRRTAGGMLVEGGQERQQEAINMDLVNMMTSTNQEGMIEAGFTGWINPFFTDLPQREGGYRFPDKMVRHRLAIAGLTGAIMGGTTTAIGTGIQEFANARRKAAEDKDSLTVTDKDGRTLIMRNLAAQRAAAAGAFRDMAAAGQGVNAQTIIGVGLSQSEGNSFASFNGITGVGKDANSAFIDLTMRANAGRRNIDLSTLTAVADGHEVTLANGEKLTVKGTNSEQTLRDLVNLHNSDNHPLVITSGATIEYNAGQAKPYTITQSNGTVVRTESLYDNYALYNFASHADSNLVFDSILRRSGTQDTEGFINLNITQTGDFNFKVSEQAIRDSIDNSNGRFVLLDATVSRKGAKQRIRANGSLQSDTMKVADLEQGIIYDIKLKRGRNNSNAHVNVTARDLGGKVLRLDADVAKQTIRDAANPSALKNQIRLKAPAKNGITIQGEQVAGQTLWHFNRNQIDEITRLTGAVLANYQDNLAEFVLPGYRRNADGTMEEFGTIFSISLDENGKVFAHANGQDIAIEGINEYDSLVPGETNLYAHALQGGRFSTVSVDQNTGAITLRRTTPGGADIELVLGRRGTIDSYRVVSDNSARAQGMVDQAIAARNAQTAAQQQTQQQMGQIVDTELQQFTTAELIQMGFDPATIHNNIRAAFSGELLAELQLTATDFQSARDILTNRFGYPADRFLVYRLMNEAGVTNQWVLTDKNDNVIATFDNTTQGFRDFKQMLDVDTVNNLLAVNEIEPYLLEQLAKNPTRPIMSFTDAEYQAAVQKFFEYHDGVFRPRPDTDNIVRSTERREALLRSYRIHFDEVYNHRVVLTDIAGIRALYGEALEEGYGLWDRVNKTFQKDANGNTYFGDRAYINSLRRNAQGAWISAYASMNAQPLYKIGNNYYSENEIVQAANKTSNLDLITEDVIENIIDRREQGYRELPSERVLRGERRYIDILNDIIHEEARRLLDPKYNDINEIAAYYGSNFVKKKTWRRMMNGEYVYLGTDGNFYSVIDVANDANIRMRVLWDDNQFPHPSQSMLTAHNYSEVYTVTNDNSVEIYYQEIRLRDQTGRKRPKADYDREINRMVQRLRMVDMLMLKHDTYDVNDQINDRILDEDQETPIPPPNRANIEADIQRELEQRAANAQTIEEFFDIYGAQVQQRYVVHDSATGLNVGRNGNTVDVGVDSFLTEAEVADYVRQHGFAATQEVTPYYVFFTGDGTAIESFAPVDYESSFMDELRLPEKVAFIDISARVDAEFQAEEARVGAQKQRREALRKQRAAAAAQAANASQNTTTQNPHATASNLSYADYLTRLFGTDSFVSLGAKVELWQGKTSMSKIMSMSIDIAYENMLAGAGERDVNDPAQSLERELNSTVGRLWRSAKARGLVRVHKTMADYWAANPDTLNKVLEDYQKKKLARETRRAQNAIPFAEIQAAVAAMSQDEIDTVTKSLGVVGQYDYDNKVIHLVEENIPLERAANVFYHELAVHATMHLTGTNLAGQWMDIMRYLKAHENDKSELGRAIRRIKANRIGVKLQKEDSNIYWEEIAAYLVEDYINRISFVERIRAFFRDVFRRTGIVRPNEEVTIADIVRFAKAKAKVTVSMSDKLDTAHQGYSHANAPFFSLMGSAYHVDAQTAQDQFESIDQYYSQVQYGDRYGMVHDRQTGILNESNLSRGHWVLARTPMFKKWFGDWENRPYNASKIVDTSGEPLLVYHNSKYDHDAYDEPFIGLNGNFGHSGKFIYQDLAENPYAEKLLGGEVAQSFINIRKPLHVHNYEEMEKYMESLGYERSSKRLDLDKLAASVRSNPSMRVVIEGIADYASDTEPTTSFADFMILNENAVFSAVPLTTMREAHQFLGGLFEAATTSRDSILVNEPVMNAETLEEWYETLKTEEERQEWRSAMEIFERNLTPFENHMLRLSYNPDGYFTHLSRGHEDLTLSTREVIRDVMGAIDARYHAYGERDIIEFREAVQRTYDEVGNDELFLDMFNMALHQARREELVFRLGEDLDIVTTPAYPVPSAQALLKEDNRELARSLKTAMMRDGYDGLLGSDDILMFHPDQAHDALGFLRPFPERNIRPTQGIRTDPREQRVMEVIDGNITRDARALGVTPVRLRSEFREIYHALGDIYFSIAWSGSSSTFDRFSTDYVMSQTGMNIDGWGLYFTDDQLTAQIYARPVYEFIIDGVTYRKGETTDGESAYIGENGNEFSSWEAIYDALEMLEYNSLERVIEQFRDKIKFYSRPNTRNTEQIDRAQTAIEFLTKVNVEAIPIRGNMYKVDIPEENEMINRTTYLSEQSEYVKEALLGLLDKYGDQLITPGARLIYGNIDIEGLREDILRKSNEYGFRASRFIGLLEAALGSPKAASLALNEFGIKGSIGYNHQGKQNKKDFVIFSDEAIKILERYPFPAQNINFRTEVYTPPNEEVVYFSMLDPYSHILVRTPSFKENFGDWQNDPNSEMVLDGRGEPLRFPDGFHYGTGIVSLDRPPMFSIRPYDRHQNIAALREAINDYGQIAFNDETPFESVSNDREDVWYGQDDDGYTVAYNNVPAESAIPELLRNYGVRFVEDLSEAERVQAQYEAAMSRQSDYIGNLYGHLLRRAGLLYEDDGSYLAGFNVGNTFILSHFAPRNIRAGARMMQNVANSYMKVMAAVPEYQGQMLERVGFRMVGQVPQIFNGELILKNVYANNAVNEQDINEAYEKFSNGRSRAEVNALMQAARVVSGRRENGTSGYFSMLGPQGAERLLGTDDYRQTAEAMRQAGKDARTIKLATGYEWSNNQQTWEYEVSNVNHTVRVDPFVNLLVGLRDELVNRRNYETLSEREIAFLEKAESYEGFLEASKETVPHTYTLLTNVFKAPEIYKAYPKAKRVKVKIDPEARHAEYHEGAKEIHIGANAAMNLLFNPQWQSIADRELRSMLLHEVQHHIQETEGFRFHGRDDSDLTMYYLDPGEHEARRVQTRSMRTEDQIRNSLFAREYDSLYAEGYRDFFGESPRRRGYYFSMTGSRDNASLSSAENNLPQGQQKQANVRYPDFTEEQITLYFSLSKKNREEAIREMRDPRRGRPDLSEEQMSLILDELDRYDQPKKQKLMLKWMLNGSLAMPIAGRPHHEAYQVDEAMELAAKMKVDPFGFESPVDILNRYKKLNPDRIPIAPESVPELDMGSRIDHGDGIVSYQVQDDKAGQQAVRRIINSHWGKNWSNWCLTRANAQGQLQQPEAWDMWSKYYNGLPKRVAFKNGKIISLMATQGVSDYRIATVIRNLNHAIIDDMLDRIESRNNDIITIQQEYNLTSEEADAIREYVTTPFNERSGDRYWELANEVHGMPVYQPRQVEDGILEIVDRNENPADLAEIGLYGVDNRFYWNEKERLYATIATEKWWDQNNREHSNLDWARGVTEGYRRRRSAIDPNTTLGYFSMRGRGEAFTNYMDDLYDRTEIVGSGGAYKLKNGKIFVDVDEVGQENVLRVMLYALIRESPEVLNNANIADAIAKIRGWESSADVRERAFFTDVKLAMTQANVPDSAILAYAVRKMLEDGIDPSNPANQTGIEGVFAAILNEIPGIIGQASGVSTTRVNVMPSDIITVTNALSGVENVGIDVAVPSLDVSEEVMQTITAASQQPPLMAAVMREVQELIASYDNAHFDTINGRPHLVLGGQNGFVLDLTLNPLYIRNVVDQFINQTTDFGNFDTTDPNSTDDENKGKPGNPFTHIVEKMGTAARLNNRARQEDVERFINTNLPAYIADRIQVVYDETPEFKTLFNDNEYGGIYRPVTADRKVIYIRAYDRNLSDVIGSIVHLTSNFGWTMWQNADFVPLMDELWTVLKHNIQNDIPTYYERLGGKPPTSSQKAALISAYLATKSKSIYDLAEFSRSPYVPSSEQQHMLDIAAKVKDQITQVELNIAKSFAQDFMNNEELVKEYSEKLLRMTMAPFYGKGMWFAYDVDYDNLKANNPNISDKYSGWGHVMVFANDFGQVYKPIPLNDDALVNQVMLQNYRKSKPFWRDVKLAIWRNWHPPMKGVGDTILGLENSILLTRVWRAVTTEWGSALENIYSRTSAFDDKLIRRGIDTEDFSRAKGYVQELQDRGITDKKLLEEAEIIDAFLRYGRQKMLQNVSEIRNLISMSAQRAEYWMRHENVPERDIMKMHREMDRYAQRFVADWEHRSYRAFSREDQDNLQEMWNILDGYSSPPTGSDWFSNIARNAQRDLATLEQQKTQGQISESDYAKQRRDLRHTIKMYERLDALYHWTNQNVMARLPNLNSQNYRSEAAAVPQRVNQEMKTEIENIMTQVKNVGQRGLLGKMDLIPAFRKRKLNENIPHDRLYMTFLDQVKNPAMSMLHNLDQQGKILDKLTFNLRFGESILQNGMGTMKGSRDHVNLGVDNLSWMESGSFLQYVKVDPFFLDEIRNEQEIQLNVREHFMGGLVNMIKQNFTVLNLRMMLSNYIGNISNMIATGQIFRWGHLKAGLIGVNKRKLTSLLETDMSKSLNRLKGDALKRSVAKGIEDYNSIVAEYTKEMERLNIWGSGTTSTDMTFYGQSGWEKVADYGAAVLEAVGAINDTTHRSVNRVVGEKLKVARELYGYGDEWVKPLTYMNNRAVAMAKYRAQENWAQYEGREDSHEARLLDERIRDMASREAAMLTMKETTTWELSPDAIRKLAAQKVRVVTPDFLLHGFQMARIMTVNVGRTFECAGEVARLMAKGKENLTEDERIYLKLVGGELIRRSIGQTLMTTTMWNMAHYGGSLGIYVLGNAIAALRGAGDEDDEERKRRRGRARSEDSTFAVSPVEHTALSMLCNAVSMVSDLYAPLMWVEGKVGKEFYALNWQRINAAYTFGTVRPASVNPTFLDRAKHVLLELADLRSDPLSVQIANIIRGKNRYDQDITRKEQLQEGGMLLLPQVGHQLNNIRLGLQQLMLGTENMSWTERRRNYPLSVYDAIGIKVRKYSVLDMIENTGREVNKLQQEYGNAYKRNFFRTLERKLDMTDKDIADTVATIVENNTYQMDRIRYSMEAFRLLGIDRKTLEERLALTRNGSHKIMGQNEIGLLLAGRDVLTANVLTNLASKIKQLQDFQSDTNIPTGERRKVLENYQRAYRKLVEAMR